MLQEERGIIWCVVAELLEWHGQLAHPRPLRRLIGRGRVSGLDPRDECGRLVVSEDGEPQYAARVLQRAVVDAAQVDRVESGVPDQLDDDRLGFLIAGQEHDPGGLAVVVVRHDARRERVEGAHPARPRERTGQRPQCHLSRPEGVGRVDHDTAVERADRLQHVGHGGARDGHQHHICARHGVGHRGRIGALPEFGRQCPRPGSVPCREGDVVAGGVPEPA